MEFRIADLREVYETERHLVYVTCAGAGLFADDKCGADFGVFG